MLHVRRDDRNKGKIYLRLARFNLLSKIQDLGKQFTYVGVRNIFTSDEYEMTCSRESFRVIYYVYTCMEFDKVPNITIISVYMFVYLINNI